MGKHGQYNYKGINAQSWAAMSLFLQHLRKSDFAYIELEAPNFEDFNLVFNDGHKIICESRALKSCFSFANLKKVVRSVLKKRDLEEKDEILIICNRLDKGMEDKVKHVEYFKKLISPDFQKKGFTSKEIAALPQVKFWEATTNLNEKIVYSLFSELINFWLPEADFKTIVDSVLLQKIYKGSEKGKSYSKTDILNQVDDLRKGVIRKSGYFDKSRIKVERQLDNIVQAIEDNKSPVWGSNQLSAISAQPNLIYFVLDKFKNKKVDKLKDWEAIWKLNRIYGFSFNLIKIFESNIHNSENRRYILSFIKTSIPEIKTFYRHDFFEMDTVNTISKILDQDKTLFEEALEIVKDILVHFAKDYFYLKDMHDLDYKRTEICKLLNRIYRDGDVALKEKIYSLAIDYFNLVEDEGEFSHYTPLEIFDILFKHLVYDFSKFEGRFMNLVNVLAEQYDKTYKKFGKKVRFNGWELMGGTTAFWGHSYKISDRHFVSHLLSPSLLKYYQEDKNRAWQFIFRNCIIRTNKISKEKPDFLNRASLNVILERYKEENEKIYREAFNVLKEFILSRKGIPHKSELVYQDLRGNFSDNKKWALVNLTIKKYKTPTDPFIEEIVSELAKKGYKKAGDIFKEWVKNPEYYRRTSFVGNGLIQHIRGLIDVDFDGAVEMFKNYISGEYFIHKLDSFDAYEVAGILNLILKKNFNIGIGILNKLNHSKQLSKNQQILLCYSLRGESREKDDETSFLEGIYNKFLNNFFNEFDNDINKICKSIPHGNAREAFVQFAESLAKAKKIKEALRIVEIFVNDPDPFSPGDDPEDREGKYSHHKKIVDEGQETSVINSVRGWCAWTLAHCVVLEGRAFLPKIVELVKQLSEDKDYYVQHMACFSLSRLVQYRLSHIPDDKNTLFLSDDKKTALEMAKEIENIALGLLDRVLASTPNVQKALAKSIMSALNSIRTLNEHDALALIEKLRKFPDKETPEITSFLLYYAEFRKDSFKDWQWSLPGLYDDLHPFDDGQLKIRLKEIMLKNAETRAAFAWEFYRLTDGALRKIKHSLDYEEAFALSVKYIKDLMTEYDHRTFETVYRFIDENIKQPSQFNTCYEFWLKCLEQEKPALEKMVKDSKAHDIYWWPHHYNGNILVLINQQKGQKEFLDMFEFLSNYPKEVDIGSIKDAVELIKKIPSPNKQVEKIFNNLIERNSNFYNDKKEWMK